MAIRSGLLREVIVMAFDTVRTNKMRSALTVLGVVIGVTSIVGMTAMIRGFDQSLRDSIGAIGPNTIFLQRFGVSSFSSGAELRDLLKRPNLTVSDARALETMAETIQFVDIELGAGGIGAPTQRRVFYRDRKSSPLVVFGTSENFAEGTRIPIAGGRFFNGTEVQYRKNVAVLGYGPYQLLFGESGTDPIGKTIRIGSDRFEVVGVFDKRPSVGGFNQGQDDFVTIPYTAYQRLFGLNPTEGARNTSILPIQIALLPREGTDVKVAMADVEHVMRIRHELRLDEPDDFDLMTQDSILKLWDQISQGTFLALMVISSIALMVGGIGVMAIMSISVTERTREIGVRKALGARRAEILFQFLMEAAFLTSLGGVIGIALGSAIGWLVHLATGFPISLPWWSFAIGLGFSASVGIFFGMWPAFKASRLDPIEALRYE
ncbi:MAG: ABC transporter permease [Acidobacteriaceae bacterium]|jgi:putative ABC transport system permease protein|nr:ABC transporter permease [Acidobacteriaceae bacterium]